MENVFYVYEHYRNDTGRVFYVGKGHARRSSDKGNRNYHWRNVVSKAKGFTIKHVAENLDEELALFVEVELISLHKTRGSQLTNMTIGGDGVSGLKHSEKTKELIRSKRIGQIVSHSEETKRKIGLANSIALKGKKNPEHSARLMGRRHSEETKAKIAAKQLGIPRSAETIEKVRVANLGQKRTDEAKRNMSLAHIGKTLSDETKAKMSESQRVRWAKVRGELNADNN